jgi:hypothetical protein
VAVFSYARRLLAHRPALWAAALGCAALLAIPGAVVAILLVPPTTMLLLTGDPLLAADVIPEEVARTGWLVPALIVAPAALTLLYNRLYAVLLWESDEERPAGWRASWRSTRRIWLKVLALNALLWATLVVAIALVAGATVLALAGSAGAATLMLLTGTGVVLVIRTIGRILVTLAARAAILEDRAMLEAWRSARASLKDRRRHIVAAWASLLALGVAAWIGGRFITPILQDTALDFPLLSPYLFAREAAQLAFAIPVEAFVLVVSSAVWTAVYREIETETAPTDARPFAPRALAILVGLVFIGNGVPAIADVMWRDREEEHERMLRNEEIAPHEALAPDADERPSSRGVPKYDVRAQLEGDELDWTTTIRYTNPFHRSLDELPVYVYPAAFSGNADELPFADELLSTTMPSSLRGDLEGGTFRIAAVTTPSGRELEWDRSDTVLRVQLPHPLERERSVSLRIRLRARLPTWPLRYGNWDGITQLGNWIPTVPVQTRDGFIIHPYYDIGDPFFSRMADYSVEIETEEGTGVVGSGRLIDVERGGDREVWRFAVEGSRDAAFAAGSSLRGLEREVGSTTVRTWYNGEDTLTGARLADESVSALQHFSQAFGPLVMDDVDVVTVSNPLGGMEYPGLVYVSSGFSRLAGLPLLPELVDHSEFEVDQERYVTGHELAHQWWYAEVGNDQVREPWLDEGFVEASTRLWLLAEDDDERTWKIAHLQRKPALGDDDAIGAPVSAFENNSDYSDAIYEAGGELLLRLRADSGPIEYERLMRAWFRNERGEIGTIGGFIDLAERTIGQDARRLLQRYL